MSEKPSPLDEPIEIAKFWKNRGRRDAVVISLREYEGRALVEARIYYTDKNGIMRPSPKGLTLLLSRLPDLSRGFAKAEAKARDLGLLDGEEGEE
jgi:Transcriptional Coactivator p15 (PC4)